jgi:hypothetical protein
MPASSGHHHRPPKVRKLRDDATVPVPAKRKRDGHKPRQVAEVPLADRTDEWWEKSAGRKLTDTTVPTRRPREPAAKRAIPSGAHAYRWIPGVGAACSCGAWTRTGTETTTTIEHRQHVAEANRP